MKVTREIKVTSIVLFMILFLYLTLQPMLGQEKEDVQWIAEPQFDEAWNFHEGVALVKYGVAYGYIDEKGKWIAKPQFDNAEGFYEGLARVQQGGKWGYIDRKGKWIAKPQFDDASIFFENMAAVQQGGKWGFIDKKGKWLIKPQFDYAEDFSEGLACVKQDGKYGYIDRDGKWIAVPQFDDAWNFHEGVARVQQGGKWGYIKNPLRAGEIEKSFEAAGMLIGTVESIEGKTVIVALKDINKQVNLGQKLCLYSGENMIIMRANFPMMTVIQCNVVSGSIKDIKAGIKVYAYREEKK
ncbi:MAG: WG repeat-containing protein [Spirochaetota bacterium]